MEIEGAAAMGGCCCCSGGGGGGGGGSGASPVAAIRGSGSEGPCDGGEMFVAVDLFSEEMSSVDGWM